MSGSSDEGSSMAIEQIVVEESRAVVAVDVRGRWLRHLDGAAAVAAPGTHRVARTVDRAHVALGLPALRSHGLVHAQLVGALEPRGSLEAIHPLVARRAEALEVVGATSQRVGGRRARLEIRVHVHVHVEGHRRGDPRDTTERCDEQAPVASHELGVACERARPARVGGFPHRLLDAHLANHVVTLLDGREPHHARRDVDELRERHAANLLRDGHSSSSPILRKILQRLHHPFIR